MRGGIGSAWRLGAEAHKSPNFWLDTLPRSERLKRNPTATAKDGCCHLIVDLGSISKDES